MQIKIKYLFLNLLLGCIFSQAKAQTDTVYVYEDVIVYDTIIVYDTVSVKPERNDISLPKLKSISLLQLDTTHRQANLLLISGKETATFSINHILLDENINKNIKNSESMKMISFFGVVLFAFKTMVIAQTDFEVHVGTGIWWENGTVANLDIPLSPIVNAGIFAKRNFGEKEIGIKTGFEYSYLAKGKSYIQKLETLDYNTVDNIIYDFEGGMQNFSIPLLLFYSGCKIQPFAGINFNYTKTGFQARDLGNSLIESYNFGLNIGTGIKLTERISVELEYKHNLTNDYLEYTFGNDGEVIENETRYLRNNQLTLSFVYEFGKKTKQTQ